jgi:twitching motility protein PilI
MHDQDSVPTPRELMALLADIEQRSHSSALGLPETEVREREWDGLAYSIGGVRVVTSMDEVSEMLPYPEHITSVPGAKPWMLGLANIRGALMPVIDLQIYLGAKAVVPSKAARMLVVRMRGLATGLLVPSVQGMRHFSEERRMQDARMKGALGDYVFDAFSIDGQIWPVFSFSALTADPDFRVAAA